MRRAPIQNPTLAETFDEIRADYAAAKSSRFRRHRSGVPTSGAHADYHYRSESDYLRLMEWARDFDRNDVLVGSLLDRCCHNTVQRQGREEPEPLVRATQRPTLARYQTSPQVAWTSGQIWRRKARPIRAALQAVIPSSRGSEGRSRATCLRPLHPAGRQTKRVGLHLVYGGSKSGIFCDLKRACTPRFLGYDRRPYSHPLSGLGPTCAGSSNPRHSSATIFLRVSLLTPCPQLRTFTVSSTAYRALREIYYAYQ